MVLLYDVDGSPVKMGSQEVRPHVDTVVEVIHLCAAHVHWMRFRLRDDCNYYIIQMVISFLLHSNLHTTT